MNQSREREREGESEGSEYQLLASEKGRIWKGKGKQEEQPVDGRGSLVFSCSHLFFHALWSLSLFLCIPALGHRRESHRRSCVYPIIHAHSCPPNRTLARRTRLPFLGSGSAWFTEPVTRSGAGSPSWLASLVTLTSPPRRRPACPQAGARGNLCRRASMSS